MNKTTFRIEDRPYFGSDTTYEMTRVHSNTPEQFKKQMFDSWINSDSGDGHDEMSITVVKTERVRVEISES